MRGNILIVGLDYQFVKDVAYELSKEVDMFFLDVNDLLEYRIIDKQNMQLVCGMEYFEKEQRKIIMGVTKYENTIVNFPYSKILNEEYAEEILSKTKFVYLKLTKKNLECLNKQKNEENKLDLELITYKEFNSLLSKKADYVVSLQSTDKKDAVSKLKQLDIFNNFVGEE